MSPFVIILLVVIHAAVSAGVGYFLFSRFTMNKEQAETWKWLGTSFSFFMPVYGMIGILSIYFVLYWKRKKADASSAENVVFDEHLRKDRISSMAETTMITPINWREEKEIQPLVDALKDSDVDMRKGAVDALAEKGDKDAIRILSDSLENTMLEVRYFAVEALAKISKDFGDQIMDAQNSVEKNPQSMDAVINLANCYYDYAASEVEDKTLSDFYLLQAHGEYEKAVKMGAKGPQMLMRYGEVLTKLERYADALAVFKDVLTDNRRDFDTDALVALADLYFKMGNLQKVREISVRLQSSPGISEEVKLATSCWIKT